MLKLGRTLEMSPHAARLILTGLLLVAAAAFPATAGANLVPNLTVNQTAGTVAGSHTPTGFDVRLNPSLGDAVQAISIAFPAGLLVDESIDNGACLASGAPVAACQIGAGTATIGGVPTPMQLYLVKAPQTSDVGGVRLVAGTVSAIGAVSFRSSLDLGIQPSIDVAEQIQFSGLSASAIGELNFTMTDVSLPTTCATPPQQVSVWASSVQKAAPARATAPFMVASCGSLSYFPILSATIARDPRATTASLEVAIGQFAGQSASQAISFTFPAGLGVNHALEPCVGGTPCPVGTASMASPLLPPGAFGQGTITLSGPRSAPVLTITFPPPIRLVMRGTVGSTVSINDIPDIPLSGLLLHLDGSALGRPFTTTCLPGEVKATGTPRSGGKTVTTTGPLHYSGCPRPPRAGPPTASGSLTGITAAKPQLRLKVTRGSHAANVKSLSIGVPRGLSFKASALRRHRTSALGLSLTGGVVQRVQIRRGQLFIIMRVAAKRAALTVRGPLLAEAAALAGKARGGELRSLVVRIRAVDASGAHHGLRLRSAVS